MIQLKVPSREEIEQLEEIIELSPEEKTYWEDMTKRRDAQFGKKDYQGKIIFYLQELQATDNKFGDRVAIERRLKYLIGHAYEALGTYESERHEPLERAEMFEKAILWYQAADETIGFFSDYSLRQAQSCLGAAHFRRQAGLEDEVTKEFFQRGRSLLSAFFGGASVIFMKSPIPEYLKQMADEKVGSVAKAYLFRDHSQDHKLN